VDMAVSNLNSLSQPHPCIAPGCENTVEYDDEPWCFTHSPNDGSYVPGYSYKAVEERRILEDPT
jgi:hypothetical protein